MPDGRSWRTDELKAAQKLLPALRESYAFEQEGAQLRRRQIDNARKHRQKMGSYPVRDEALGKDRRGRRYWAFSADPARLWVESPANDAAPWEYEGGTWYFYDTVELVKAMADSLDGADAESGEKELKKVWDASRTGQQWRTRTAHHLTPHSSLGRRCARRCRCSRRTWPRRRCRTRRRGGMTRATSTSASRCCARSRNRASDVVDRQITRWLPPTGETVFHVVHDDDGDEEDLDQAEADEARKEYDEDGGGVEALTALQAQPVYENSYERLKKDRITASWLGVAGARGDLLELEEALQSAQPQVDADARSTWLLSARNSESVAVVAPRSLA